MPTVVREASDLIRLVAGPREGSVKASIARAARRLGLKPSRAKTLWYGEAKRIDAGEMDALRRQAAEVERRRAIAAVAALRAQVRVSGADDAGAALVHLDRALVALGGGDPPAGAGLSGGGA